MTPLSAKQSDLLSRLRGLMETRAGERWYAFCPVCTGDKTRKLTVTRNARGMLLLACKRTSGCKSAEVVKALGLNLSYLYPGNDPDFEARMSHKTPSPPERVYPYRAEDGTVLYEVCRFKAPPPDNKRFSQRRPNPEFYPGGKAPRYLTNLDGVRRVPYRLPELLAGWRERPDRWVVFVEGEKDAENLAALDVLATCTAQGADGWRGDYGYAAHFRGRRVAVFYDLDPYSERQRKRPGLAFALAVCRDLCGVAAEVRLCRYPGLPDDQKLDGTDWLRSFAPGTPPADKRRALWDAVAASSAYYPGWEDEPEFVRKARAFRAKLAQTSEPWDLNRSADALIRKVRALLDGCSLDTLPDDMAKLAGGLQHFAEMMFPLARGGILLGPTPEAPPHEAKDAALPQALAAEAGAAEAEGGAAGGPQAAEAEAAGAEADEPVPC